MSIPVDVVQYTEEFTSEQEVVINHNFGYRPVVRIQIDDGGAYDYRLVFARIVVTTTTITVTFTPYTLSGRITYV